MGITQCPGLPFGLFVECRAALGSPAMECKRLASPASSARRAGSVTTVEPGRPRSGALVGGPGGRSRAEAAERERGTRQQVPCLKLFGPVCGVEEQVSGGRVAGLAQGVTAGNVQLAGENGTQAVVHDDLRRLFQAQPGVLVGEAGQQHFGS